MNINFNVFNSYVKPQELSQAPKENEGAGTRTADAKQDRVSISADAAAYCKATSTGKAITAEVEQSGSDACIAALHEQVQSGAYRVSTDALADAILDRII